MVHLYDAYDQISDFCHQQSLRKMWRKKILDGRKDRGKTVYPPPPSGSGGTQASYRCTILWVAFLDPSDSYFLFANLVDFYTHWTYMLIFRRIFPSNYWWQESDIWSQASYRYAILWEAFLDPSDSFFLFDMGYLYDACDQISDLCHQYLLRKMWRKMCIYVQCV
jgi:hypothetical protein